MRNEAAILEDQLRAAATAGGGHVVEGHVRTGSASTVPEVHLAAEAALAVIAATRPRILYLDVSTVDIDELTQEARDRLGLDDEDAAPPALKAALAPLRKHSGEPCSTSAHFVVDSVLHSTEASAAWFDEFVTEIERLEAAAREASDGVRERLRAARSAHIEELAQLLRADAAFHFGKTSAAKRHLLAQKMFPTEDSRLLDEVVELAQHLDWLDQSGFSATP